MANELHLEILKLGVDAWNMWRNQNPSIRPDLFGANLTGATLQRGNLIEANLKNANLSGANLESARLQRADLSRANLSNTRLSYANLSEVKLNNASLCEAYLSSADLTGAKLKNTNLSGANFSFTELFIADLRGAKLTGASLLFANLTRADLCEANFSRVTLRETHLVDVDLSTTKNLETCIHEGPSYLDHHTLMRSGRLPDVFLRGCGLPDSLINYLPSLLNEPVQFYSCFISYSSRDEEFAKRLHADLQNHGVRCWFAPEDMKIGDRIRPVVDESIRVYDKLLLILTEQSIKSAWVEKEVETAFEKEQRQHQTVLFPIRLDEAVMEATEAWAADIRRTRHIGDFSGWKNHDSYRTAFERLLRDLKATATPARK